VFDALRAGAVGYLLKDVSAARLVEAIHAAARDESVLQPSVAAKVVARFARLPDAEAVPQPQPLVVPLSDRELDVVRLVAEGRSNREIAAALFLAEGTVKNHVTNVLSKLGARDRTQAALRARALGLPSASLATSCRWSWPCSSEWWRCDRSGRSPYQA
jgi:DNA-binding NarL/FixJ family response regulator